MINKKIRNLLEKQQYRVVGEHSAVKICGWTKNALRGKGGCYKWKFYGIESSRCMQLTTCLSCANRCIFCWRDYKEPVSKKWKGKVDKPEFILRESLEAQRKLLSGFGGFEKTNKKLFEDSKKPKHAALSLTGEPIVYPKINELIELMHKNKISTFLVTNGQYPKSIKNLKQVTQLYLSVDAPNKKLLKKIDIPLFKDYWERLNKSLEELRKRKERTCIRLTLVKDWNMKDIADYEKLIEKARPDFIEVKAYMHVGSSIYRLKREAMPSHEEIKEFSMRLVDGLGDYEIVNEDTRSRVVLIAKKKYKKKGKWNILIDFEKFFDIVNKGGEAIAEKYSVRTK